MVKKITTLLGHHTGIGEDLDVETRNMIALGFKNSIGKYQVAIRVVNQIGKSQKYKKYE
jgi:hypothetical protein